MKFIDLFAGLGGFYQGLTKAGFECVFASELVPQLRVLYEKNHKMDVHGDITKISTESIPRHDLLCAGFPCQSFSLAGKKQGSSCKKNGKLIDHIVRITNHHKPKLLLLENVPSIIKIEGGDFWKYIKSSFAKVGYSLIYKVISPNDIGIPQNRKRIFILGSKNRTLLDNFKWPKIINKDIPLSSILDISLPHKKIEFNKSILLHQWQQLLNNCSMNISPSISIVAPEFGANYPINFKHKTLKQMQGYKGKYGARLSDCQSWETMLNLLPNYINKDKQVPGWMIKSVKYSRELYKNNEPFLSGWSSALNKNHNSWQILEWRGYANESSLFKHIIQFRPSGIRVIKGHYAPSLVAMTPTQIPIIGAEMRYMSRYEAAKLQHLHRLKTIPDNNAFAFEALGNAVNAKIVELIAKQLKYVS